MLTLCSLALQDFLGLSNPATSIYIPMTMEELKIPLLEAALQHHNDTISYAESSHSQAQDSSTSQGPVAASDSDSEVSGHCEPFEQTAHNFDDVINWELTEPSEKPSDQLMFWKQGSFAM